MSAGYRQISIGTRLIPTRPSRPGTHQSFTQSPSVPIHAIAASAAMTVCGILAVGMTRWDRPFGQGQERCRECSVGLGPADQ